MNDIFKFRVWNIKENFYCDQNGDMVMSSNGDCYDNGVRGDFSASDGLVVEQCTGLRDKNGNLIYIGDIIKCGNGPLSTATVQYANGENFIDGIHPFNLYHDCGDECHCQLRDYPEYACEIIGNIHEQAKAKKDNK